MAKDEQPARREQARQRLVIQAALRERLAAVADVLLAIRRVGEDEVVAFAGRRELRQRGEDILHAHAEGIRGQVQRRAILLNDARVLGRKFDAQSLACAATETFETERAGAAKKFQHARALDARSNTVEEGLPHHVRRGPHVEALGRFENESAG